MRKIVSPLDGIRSPFGRAPTGSTPPVYFPSLDMSNAQNSQYLPVLFTGF